MLSFKPTFSLSTFTFIKRLFSSSSLSAIKVVSSAYLRLLIFLPAILIPACASSSPVLDRKSTRLNSSHHSISYAVFCLKKKISIARDRLGQQRGARARRGDQPPATR